MSRCPHLAKDQDHAADRGLEEALLLADMSEGRQYQDLPVRKVIFATIKEHE